MGEISQFVNWGRKIVCVARNYALHAHELNNPVPTKPFFFLKPPTAFVVEPNPIILPFPGVELHYEVELGIVIGKTGKNIQVDKAFEYIGGYALALDMTARCAQEKAKEQKRPWAESKGFDTSCPISSFIPKESLVDPQNTVLRLSVNDALKQDGNTKNMLFNISQLLAECSSKWTLERGDVLLTGTPEGVGRVFVGDVLKAEIPDVVSMTFIVAEAEPRP